MGLVHRSPRKSRDKNKEVEINKGKNKEKEKGIGSYMSHRLIRPRKMGMG